MDATDVVQPRSRVVSDGRATNRPGRALVGLLAGALALAVGVFVLAGAVAARAFVAAGLGLALALVGVALLALAFAQAFRGRPWYAKLLAVPIALVVLQWACLPAVTAGLVTSSSHERSPDATSLGRAGARDVAFRARDGVSLRGWYLPGNSGAAVIVLHGAHGSRSDVVGHIRMLTDRGYAVLAYDARGHGESGGRTNAFGWGGDADLASAVTFLRRQPGIDASRIAALGLSMGGEVALRAAGNGTALRAIVADGAGASTLGDTQIVSRGPLAPMADSVTRLTMGAVAVVSREPEPEPLRRVAARVHDPVLLIASNRRDELALDRAFAEEIGPNATVWHVANAGHTKALAVYRAVYARRVAAFLESVLAP